MSQSEETNQRPVRALVGEATRYEHDAPLDEHERTNVYNMIRAANVAISNKNLRAMATLVASHTEAHYYDLDPTDILERGEWLIFMRDRFNILFRHIYRSKLDLTNEVLYDPSKQTWLLEENADYNQVVDKLIRESFQKLAAEHRPLLTSGDYPNQELHKEALDHAFLLRNSYHDMGLFLFEDRDRPLANDRSVDWDSHHFQISDLDITEKLLPWAKLEHNHEQHRWDLFAYTELSGHPLVGHAGVAPRLETPIVNFIWRARAIRERTMGSDGSELSYLDALELEWDDERDPFGVQSVLDNHYIEQPLEELRQRIRTIILEATGIALHQFQIGGR